MICTQSNNIVKGEKRKCSRSLIHSQDKVACVAGGIVSLRLKFLAASPLVAVLPPNLTSTQYCQLCRLWMKTHKMVCEKTWKGNQILQSCSQGSLLIFPAVRERLHVPVVKICSMCADPPSSQENSEKGGEGDLYTG